MASPDLLGVVVADMGRALAFHRLLGMEIPRLPMAGATSR